MALRTLFAAQSPLTLKRYNFLFSSICLVPKNPNFYSSESIKSDPNVDKVFHIIHNCPTPLSLKQALDSSDIRLSTSLADDVLKRVRFSHSNPLQALDFYYYLDSKREFFHSSFSFDTMLYILGRHRKFELMWQLLSEAKKKDRTLISSRTLQVVLGRVAKVCSVQQTVVGFKKFRKLVYDLDTDWFNGLLRVLCQEKTMVDVRNVYHDFKRDFKPNLMTFNILLSGWKSSEDAESFFEEMKQMGVVPDIVSYNSLIDVCCKSHEMKKAYDLVAKMREEGISPDVFTYTSLIGGLGLSGQPDKAKGLLKEMKEYGCYPDVPAYNAAIRNYCIAKRLETAFELLNEMVENGLKPNPTSFNLFFRVFYQSNDLKSAWTLYGKMMLDEILPNTQSCMFLIKLCKRQEKVEMALELWNDMIEKGFGSYILVSDVMFDLLCDLGKLDDAEKCFLQMLDKRQKPSSLTFKRIKVLMELANRNEALKQLSEKMDVLWPQPQFKRPNDDFDDATSLQHVEHVERKEYEKKRFLKR